MSSRVKLVVVSLSLIVVVLLLVGAVLARTKSDSKGAYPHIAVFTEVLSRIKSEYVEEPDLSSVTNGALTGMLEAIDPYASYLNADQYFEYGKFKDSQDHVAGIALSRRFGMIGVIGVIPGSPADKAGLGTGDVIESIDGISTRDMPLAYAEILLKGARGPEAQLDVIRLGTSAAEKMTLTLGAAPIPTLFAKLLDQDVGYIRPDVLISGRAAQVAKAIQSLSRQGAKRFVLDLRNASIGNDEEGLKLANLFLKSGEMAWVQGQKIPKKVFNAVAEDAVTEAPLVVITNRGTANGAEIAAAVLQAAKRAQVVGDRTYGDAGQRGVVSLDDGSALILTLGKYYTSSAKEAIQDRGVTPTVLISDYTRDAEEEEGEGSSFDIRTFRQNRPAPEADKVVKKAIEVLVSGAPREEGDAKVAYMPASSAVTGARAKAA